VYLSYIASLRILVKI